MRATGKAPARRAVIRIMPIVTELPRRASTGIPCATLRRVPVGRAGRERLADRAGAVIRLGVREELPPGTDIRPAPQQRAALPLGHATPDTELHVIVQGVRQALCSHQAAEAAGLHPVLRGTLDEQLVRVDVPAGRDSGPVAVGDAADDTGGTAATTSSGDGRGWASGHATCLSRETVVKGPVRVTWRRWRRAKPYGVPWPRHRPHSGGYRYD